MSELESLEKQISNKLQSNEPIDVEYWEQLLESVAVYKSRAELNAVYKSIIQSRLSDFRQEQQAEATHAKTKLSLLLEGSNATLDEEIERSERPEAVLARNESTVAYSRELDPEPLLKLRAEDKSLELIEEREFLDKIVSRQAC